MSDLGNSEERKQTVFPDEETKKAADKALKLLLHQERTRAELDSRLKGAGFSAGAAEFAISYAESFGYIDDARYASKYVEFKRSTKSRREIRHKLSEKGVSDTDIEEALADYTDEDELTAIEAILTKRLRGRTPAELSYEEKQKHMRYLTSRGFSMGLIRKAIMSD